MLALCKVAFALGGLPVLVHGHAYLTQPAMRGGAFNNAANAYCPQCLGSTVLPMPTCGISSFLNVAGPVTELRAGEKAEFVVTVTAHHLGHFVFRLCDQPISSQMGGLDAQEACLNQHVLKRARPEEVHSDCVRNDPRGDCQPYDEANPGHWYLPPYGNIVYRFHYWIPSNFTCERCTLQWWWQTANSCTPHPDAYKCYFQEMERQGWSAGDWCTGGACLHKQQVVGACPASQGAPVLCGEQFKNCADVRVTSGGSAGAPAPAPPPATPAPPAAALGHASVYSYAVGVEAKCEQNADCVTNPWCKDPTFIDWCPLHPASECREPHCVWTGAAAPHPSPEPESESESEPESEPMSESQPQPSQSEPEPEPEPSLVPPSASYGKQLVAFVENWKACPSLEKIRTYDKVIVSFAVSYTWDPVKNQCSADCSIGAPVPVCAGSPQPGLIQTWQQAGTKVLLSFGGAGMGGSWGGDVNDCWEMCMDRTDSVVDQLVTIVEAQGFDGVDIDYEYFHSERSSQFLKDLTTMLRYELPVEKIISHAPMDGDIFPGAPYFNVLKEVAWSVDYVLPQYYNGPFRPAIDTRQALDHMGNLVKDVFGGDAGKVLFGFCISDCSSSGSNVGSYQAVSILQKVAQRFPDYGGAFLWAASKDNGWSAQVVQALRVEPTTTIGARTSPATSSPPAVQGACVGVQPDGQQGLCTFCLASNGVCYHEDKSWCDNWSGFQWCGQEERLMATSGGLIIACMVGAAVVAVLATVVMFRRRRHSWTLDIKAPTESNATEKARSDWDMDSNNVGEWAMKSTNPLKSNSSGRGGRADWAARSAPVAQVPEEVADAQQSPKSIGPLEAATALDKV